MWKTIYPQMRLQIEQDLGTQHMVQVTLEYDNK